jgi:uncharacterized protein YciI
MKNYILSILISFALFSLHIRTVAQTDIEKKYQMKQYFMVFLKAGPHRNQDSATVVKIQEGHLNNISRLVDEKKMVLAGPFLDEGIYKGIFLFDVATETEVIEILKTDPAVKAGRLEYEIHPWYGPGNIRFGKE